MAEIRVLDESDLARAAALVAELQADPTHHIGYYNSEAAALELQMRGFQPIGVAGSVGAFDDGELIGLLQADWDTDPPRTWWHGPMIRDERAWDDLADRLYGTARALVPDDIVQEELCPDTRNTRVGAFAERHGFVSEIASSVLWRELHDPPVATTPDEVSIRSFTDRDAPALTALHDRLFAGTHTPGARLADGDHRWVTVAERTGELVGYIAVERQEDGDGYIDYLGVHEAARRIGIGRELIACACEELRQAGVPRVDLTVNEDNVAARRLYVSLGFTEERILAPWRRGFKVHG